MLSDCIRNGNVFRCTERRFVVDAVVKTVVTEHQVLNAEQCPNHIGNLAGKLPENVNAYVKYGDLVAVTAGLLSTYGAVSAKRIQTLMKSMLKISISTGTIISMIRKCAEKVAPTIAVIREKLAGKQVCNFDETGVRVNGTLYRVHNSSTPDLTYQTVHTKRGKEGIDGNGVISDFHGIAVHDCWSSYWKYNDVGHAVCGAHLLRELTGIEDNYPDHTWANDFKKLLITMKKTKDRAVRKRQTKLSYYHLHKFDKEYKRVMKLADSECPPTQFPSEKKRGRAKKGKERSLIERLMTLKNEVCLFVHEFQVPFDNNQAERDLRNVKTKNKVIGCFRAEHGAHNYLDIMSFLNTGLKHGIGVVESLSAAFAGNGNIVLQSGF